MTDKIVGIINIPDKEEGIRSKNPKRIIEDHYSDYFRDFSKEKLLLAIQKVKKSGINFKKDKEMITKIIDEARNL